jgi:hypothetical protein
MNRSQIDFWRANRHEVLQKHESFQIVKIREDICILPSCYVLTKKISPALTKLKARLKIKGPAQIPWRDYDDIDALTLSREGLRVLFDTVSNRRTQMK